MKYEAKHEEFLRLHEKTSRKELAELFNKKFNSSVTHKAMAQKCRKLGLKGVNNGCFQKGNVPFNKGKKGLLKANKTSFKKGFIPPNTKPIGTIVSVKDRSGVNYLRIKVAEPNGWKLLHTYIWESMYGVVPKGYCVIFKDKNTLNTRLDNLMLVSRNELLRLNKKYKNIHHSLKETALNVIKISNEMRKKA